MSGATVRGTMLALMMSVTVTGCAQLGFRDDDGPARFSEDWYSLAADRPVGARQRLKKGKLWPPFPRPTGKHQPLSHRYHAAHYWPYPYIIEDRGYVQDVIHQQTDNGWTSMTTLYEYHFNPETQKLTDAGRLHLRWMLENAPPSNRLCWVQTGTDTKMSQTRLSSVRSAAVAMVGEENLPPIMLRVATPVGRPAEFEDVITKAYLQSTPKPRIEYQVLPTGTGGN